MSHFAASRRLPSVSSLVDTAARLRTTGGSLANVRRSVADGRGAQRLALETRALRKRIGAQEVLAGVDLAIPEGSLAVVLGPHGSGKSMLVKALAGLLEPDSGDVLVRDRSLSRMSRSEVLALRRDIGVMFQEGGLFSSLTVFENVAFPLRQHTDLGEGQIQELVDAQIDAVGLVDVATRMPTELSATVKKRASLARALVLEPGIVVCDEPDGSVDGPSSVAGRLLIERHARVGGTTVIATRDVDLAWFAADHLSVLSGGTVLASGPRDDVFASDHPDLRRILADRKVDVAWEAASDLVA